MDIATIAQALSSSATLCLAVAVLFQVREQRKARHDQTRLQVMVDVNYSQRRAR